MYMCACIYMYVYVYVYIYIYTHIKHGMYIYIYIKHDIYILNTGHGAAVKGKSRREEVFQGPRGRGFGSGVFV